MSHESLQCMIDMCHSEHQSSRTHTDLTQWVFHNSQTLHQQHSVLEKHTQKQHRFGWIYHKTLPYKNQVAICYVLQIAY